MKPWYKVVTPREDLCDGRPLDAAEFAVHLDQVRHGTAPADYRDPERFFARTYLTRNLTELATQVVRRLSGEKTETSAVFNLATQFGGGKTHALALLFHLAKAGPKSHRWMGVQTILDRAKVKSVPASAVAIFVGTEFDSLAGRGGSDGTPLRKTPWGEIAFQLAGEEGFAFVAEHDKRGEAPAGDVIRKFLPADQPALILVDELMNYISRNRKSGLGGQLYNFLHNLSEISRGSHNVVLAVSIPASEMEMTAEDQSDFERFKKMLDRLGKAIVMSAEGESSEIIRRRLFEWDERAVTSDGRVMLSEEAVATCRAFASWAHENRQQLPTQFNVDTARDAFAATYPFHPALISVFERKWQALPRFQQTRGMLRLLALWVSKAYQDGFKGAHKDSLIGLGTAPLDEAMFRSAAFEQLGETKLEGPVATDIAGKKDSHAGRLDAEATPAIKQARLHRKVATAVFFESNGGQAKAEATLPELRFAVGGPDIDLGNIETALEALSESCYYLTVERARYRFSLRENLNKRFTDRRANIMGPEIDAYLQTEIQKGFGDLSSVERVFFPQKTIQVPDRPVVTLVVMAPDQSLLEKETAGLLETLTKEYGQSSRCFKSALIFSIPDAAAPLREEARKVLAWEALDEEAPSMKLDDGQVRQLDESLKRAKRDMKESVWRTYKTIALLGKDGNIRMVDLGLVHSSAAADLTTLILNRLRQDGDVETGISPSFLNRNWPPALAEWSTKSVRDAFFASPLFPRLLSVDALRETICRGVGNGLLAYVGKAPNGEYRPFYFNQALMSGDIEFSDEVFIIPKEAAEKYLAGKKAAATTGVDPKPPVMPPVDPTTGGKAGDPPVSPVNPKAIASITWRGTVAPQKWMNFYSKVLAKFISGGGVTLTVEFKVSPPDGLSPQKVDETKSALRELGLIDNLDQK